ncbi:LysR substrate-binding domain-containing protein [Streptomyces sp. NPDC017964]|uniref:LysR substrate-binding domain-containing protein n=1 Tax=Streptomyces sp. NPDC017964 TaxID=3365022 RepID=UPI003791A436
MEIRQLEYLLAVASEGSFTKAAAKLGVVQSAVSHQIAKLEDELGMQLLDRHRPVTRPTDAGALFTGRVTRALADLSDAREEVLGLRGQTVGEVTLGAVFPTASLDIPAILAGFQAYRPAVRVILREGSAPESLEGLKNDSVDMALMTAELKDLPPDIEGVVADHSDLVLAGKTGHRLEAHDRVDIEELDGEIMIGFRRGTGRAGLRAATDAVLAQHGVTPKIMVESNELPVLIGLVQHGHGLAVIPRQFFADPPAGVWMRELNPPITPSLLLVWRRGRRYPPAPEEFLRFIAAKATTSRSLPQSRPSSVSPLSYGAPDWEVGVWQIPSPLPDRTVVVGSQKRRPVSLTAQDREELVRVTTTGVRGASMIMRARVLLALDSSVGEVDTKEAIAVRLGVSGETLRLVAKRFAETGGDVHATIARKKRDLPPVPSPVTGEVEARLIAMACSQPPQGYARWSLRLLEKHVALVEDIPDLDHSTIGRILKKRNCVLT